MKKMKTERSFKDRRKKGVSPVIGVILMVAATIVIAAVVLAMLGGFAPPAKSYVIGLSAKQVPGPDIQVTLTGSGDVGSLNYVQATVIDAVTGTTTQQTIGTPAGFGTASGTNDITVGAICSYVTDMGGTAANLGTGSSDDHVIVVGTFLDGTSQVILDTWL
jgi:flagellin-like protein